MEFSCAAGRSRAEISAPTYRLTRGIGVTIPGYLDKYTREMANRAL
jgi:hypothetical protein